MEKPKKVNRLTVNFYLEEDSLNYSIVKVERKNGMTKICTYKGLRTNDLDLSPDINSFNLIETLWQKEQL